MDKKVKKLNYETLEAMDQYIKGMIDSKKDGLMTPAELNQILEHIDKRYLLITKLLLEDVHELDFGESREAYFKYTMGPMFGKMSARHKLKFLIETAPLTMDLDKVKNHIGITYNVLLEVGLPKETCDWFYRQVSDTKYITRVDSYRIYLTKIVDALFVAASKKRIIL